MNLSSLEDVVTAATTIHDAGTLAMALKAFLKRDVAEHLLASALPNDQDPLAMLNPLENTLGYLFILSVSLCRVIWCLKAKRRRHCLIVAKLISDLGSSIYVTVLRD